MGIGSVLQQLLAAKNTNVNEVSIATGVHPQTLYSMIKRDSMKASITDLYKVAHHLGVDLNYFYNALSSAGSMLEIPPLSKMPDPTTFASPATTRITEKLPKLKEDQLESIEKRIDIFIDDNEVEARGVMAQQMKKVT